MSERQACGLVRWYCRRSAAGNGAGTALKERNVPCPNRQVGGGVMRVGGVKVGCFKVGRQG